MFHLEINTLNENEHVMCCDLLLGGNLITKEYYTRTIIGISCDPQSEWIIVKLHNNTRYILTHDQNCTVEEVYIVDKVNTVAPSDLADLANKLALLIKS